MLQYIPVRMLRQHTDTNSRMSVEVVGAKRRTAVKYRLKLHYITTSASLRGS